MVQFGPIGPKEGLILNVLVFLNVFINSNNDL